MALITEFSQLDLNKEYSYADYLTEEPDENDPAVKLIKNLKKYLKRFAGYLREKDGQKKP